MTVSEKAELAAKQIVKEYIDRSAHFMLVHAIAEIVQQAMEDYYDERMQDREGS